ncbi:FeS assembly SUF system protein [Acuticoccus sediminis]|uniref:FeS assembly SUF system protein n=2 Tax=Acuticoccus sediminis TaxID=2184697 RepID=A0A8B2NVH9_9HYPH|nr:FeS assembly SUF system protein [Acuticoccus sediminis]
MTYGYVPKISAPSAVEDQMVAALRTVVDPEIPVNIYDLGLIYEATVDENAVATIAMTLTAPSCPVAGQLVEWVQKAVNDVPGIDATVVRLVFDPPWDSSRMSEEACLELGLI